MMNSAVEKLWNRIGEIDDFYLEEAETADIAQIKAVKRKRIVKYSAFGAAGLAALGGAAAMYWRFRTNRMVEST